MSCPDEAKPPVFQLPVVSTNRSLDPSSAAARLADAFLKGRKCTTIRSYRSDLENFASFLGADTIDQAAALLLAGGPGEANATALGYKAHLLDHGLTAATINCRLAALRSMVKLARTLGMIPWTLEVQGMKSEPYRDTRGPGRDGFRALLEILATRTDVKAVRDRAIIRCLFDLGLRRAEVVGLDLTDFDQVAGTLAVLGKGRTAKVNLTLPSVTRAELDAWIEIRNDDLGPLFTTLHRNRPGKHRLTGGGLYFIVTELGNDVGIQVRPHGLRHAAITEALDLTHGNIRAVQKFSRHRDVRVIERYDDVRVDLAGEVARKVASSV